MEKIKMLWKKFQKWLEESQYDEILKVRGYEFDTVTNAFGEKVKSTKKYAIHKKVVTCYELICNISWELLHIDDMNTNGVKRVQWIRPNSKREYDTTKITWFNSKEEAEKIRLDMIKNPNNYIIN